MRQSRVVAGIDVARKQVGSCNDETRSAEAALDRACRDERLLNLVQSPILGQPFDRDDLVSLGLGRED